MPTKLITQLTVSTAVLLTGLFLIVGMAMADGVQDTETKKTEKETCVTAYGGGTDCTKEVIEETVARDETTHKTVDAGIEDLNLPLIAGTTLVLSGLLYVGARKTQTLYLFE